MRADIFVMFGDGFLRRPRWIACAVVMGLYDCGRRNHESCESLEIM